MAEKLPVLHKPLSYKQLKKRSRNGTVPITEIVSLEWPGDHLSVDDLNDLVSELITADPSALTGIEYRLVGVNIEKQEILVQVTGAVADYLDYCDNN